MLTVILFLVFAIVVFVGFGVAPSLYGQIQRLSDKRQQKFAHKVEEFIPKQKVKSMAQMFLFAPIAFGAAFYLVAPDELKMAGVIFGIIIGFVFPGIYIQMLANKAKSKFENQLIDALMIMSSSFRGGLSLVQALEAVVDEMPDPINREFGIVLGENKMGVSLEDALSHLYNRVPSNALQQMITAILLARETGGNLPQIFSRIVTNIREAKKIRQNLETLTIQGKIQGVVMTILPIAFAFVVYSSNKRIFDNMLSSEMGRTLLIVAAVLWLCGAFGIWKVSTFKDF